MKGMLVKKNFFLSNSMIIRSSEKSQIIQKSNRFIIELNESLINLFFNIKNWKAVKTFNTYIKHLEFTFNECDAESIKMQFILPFSYPIFKRRQFIFRIKKSYQLFKNHKLLF